MRVSFFQRILSFQTLYYHLLKGDSGGPLVCLLDEQVWIQVGITSYGIGCADKNYPGVYARVASHTNWIQAGM